MSKIEEFVDINKYHFIIIFYTCFLIS